jgi:hypothetical protein
MMAATPFEQAESETMTTKTKTTKAATTARSTKKPAKAPAAKPAKKNATVAKSGPKEPKPEPKRMSQIAAAVEVLSRAGEPMNCKAMVDAMQQAGLWSSPGGATPEATLYASILRELATKGKDARFRKVDRGLFALASQK